MDHFTDVLATFLNLDRGNYMSVRDLSDSIKNILICVPKMNEGLMCLERSEGE